MHNTKILQRIVLVAIGFVQGFVIWALRPHVEANAADINLRLIFVYFTLFYGFLIQFAWSGLRVKRLLVSALVPSLIFSALFYCVSKQQPVGSVAYRGDDFRILTFVIASFISFKIILAFLQVSQEQGTLRSPRYDSLFNHSWNNVFIFFLAILFELIFFLLILLWMKLFLLLKVTVFSDLFTSRAFVFIVYPMIFGLGISFGKEGQRILNALRNVTFTLAKTLLPLLSVIALLFLFTLPVKGMKLLWGTGYASPLLLVLMGFSILFVNAVFQDGKTESHYPTFVRGLVNGLLMTLPVFSVITFYSVGLRIREYGVTPDRFFVLIFAFLTILYGLGYSAAVFKKKEIWLGFIGSLNIIYAPVVVGIAILVHSPLLDPLKVSAESQYQRLLQGKVDVKKFDFNYLQDKLGHLGHEKLTLLSKLTEHPKEKEIRDEATKAFATSYQNYGYNEPKNERLRSEIQVLTRHKDFPTELSKRILDKYWPGQECGRSADYRCVLFSENLDADPEDEYLLFISSEYSQSIALYDQDKGTWEYFGTFNFKCEDSEDNCGVPENWDDRNQWRKKRTDEVVRLIQEKSIQKIPSKYSDFKIGSWELSFSKTRY